MKPMVTAKTTSLLRVDALLTKSSDRTNACYENGSEKNKLNPRIPRNEILTRQSTRTNSRQNHGMTADEDISFNSKHAGIGEWRLRLAST